jgi:hypothetical protein
LPGHEFANNLLLSDADRRQVQDWWPSSNLIPSNPNNLGAVGWVKATDAYNGKPDFRLGSNSVMRSKPGLRGGDGKDVGVDMDALEAAQGKVTLKAPSEITAASAQINFAAPDSQACPVDYSSKDVTLISSFSRAADGGRERNRSVSLTGLAAGTLYHYRVNCMVEQPTGEFRTR